MRSAARALPVASFLAPGRVHASVVSGSPLMVPPSTLVSGIPPSACPFSAGDISSPMSVPGAGSVACLMVRTGSVVSRHCRRMISPRGPSRSA